MDHLDWLVCVLYIQNVIIFVTMSTLSVPRTVLKNRIKWSSVGVLGPRSLAMASGFKGSLTSAGMLYWSEKSKECGEEKGTKRFPFTWLVKGKINE